MLGCIAKWGILSLLTGWFAWGWVDMSSQEELRSPMELVWPRSGTRLKKSILVLPRLVLQVLTRPTRLGMEAIMNGCGIYTSRPNRRVQTYPEMAELQTYPEMSAGDGSWESFRDGPAGREQLGSASYDGPDVKAKREGVIQVGQTALVGAAALGVYKLVNSLFGSTESRNPSLEELSTRQKLSSAYTGTSILGKTGITLGDVLVTAATGFGIYAFVKRYFFPQTEVVTVINNNGKPEKVIKPKKPDTPTSTTEEPKSNWVTYRYLVIGIVVLLVAIGGILAYCSLRKVTRKKLTANLWSSIWKWA